MKNEDYIEKENTELTEDQASSEAVESNDINEEDTEQVNDMPSEEALSTIPEGQSSLFESESDSDPVEDDAIYDEAESQNDEAHLEEAPDGESVDMSEYDCAADSDIKESEEESVESPTPENKSVTEGKQKKADSLFDFLELFVFTLAAVFIITSFFFRYSIVDGGSMENTLRDDERLILSSFLYTPERGDVIVVQDKSTELKDPIVKRVIAVGGDTIRVTRTAIYVNGEKLTEDYVYTDDYYDRNNPEAEYTYSVNPGDALLPDVSNIDPGNYYEVTIPEGKIFVMGDHRNNSKDSREIGLLHEDAVIGKVVLRFYPINKFGKIE